MRKLVFLLLLHVVTSAGASPLDPLLVLPGDTGSLRHLEGLQRAFVDDRFGMFICYNIMSYGARWSEADNDISVFNPQQLDCGQWAQAAKSAGMRFGLLTTKHHEGFCLWDSATTDYDVASTPYRRDIVRQYSDAFRNRGLKVGLYYSVWDTTHRIERDNIGSKQLAFIKDQIRELLTNYGDIYLFVIDGWFWQSGHRQVPYNEIRELIRELQPNCLFTCHTHLQAKYHVDLPYFEGPFGAFPSEDNRIPGALGHCIARGNGWFWGERTPDTVGVEDVNEVLTKLTTLEARYCTLMLNCMPNRQGRLDKGFEELLAAVGERWQPDPERSPLPAQGAQLIYYVEPDAAFASSGEGAFAIDACLHRDVKARYKHWVADAGFPQSITLDLGSVYDGLELVSCVPNHKQQPRPETALREGNITEYRLSLSDDKQTYRQVAAGQWDADAQMKTIVFPSDHARYIRLDVLAAQGERVVVTELAVGAYSRRPWLKLVK